MPSIPKSDLKDENKIPKLGLELINSRGKKEKLVKTAKNVGHGHSRDVWKLSKNRRSLKKLTDPNFISH